MDNTMIMRGIESATLNPERISRMQAAMGTN